MTIPSSSYRIQFNAQFGFRELAAIVDYLDELGITTIYASPILKAVPGSEHGYDGINPCEINPELGTLEDLFELSRLLHSKGMSWIQDIVPNHLAFTTQNEWLRDVLARGRNSTYAQYFDIDWDHPFFNGKLMVPLLGEPTQQCIESGKLKVHNTENGFVVSYFDEDFPLRSDINYYQYLQGMDSVDDPAVVTEVLNKQHYQLFHYTESNKYINYRRFFIINSMISLRMEDQQVFDEYHSLIFDLYEKDVIQGLRIDHIDGLKDPRGYIDRLRNLFGHDCYIIVEKILDAKEQLPDLDIQGTSGYEFLSYINQVMTDMTGANKLVNYFNKLVPAFSNYEELVFEKKWEILTGSLNGDWDNLARHLYELHLVDEEGLRLPRVKMAVGVFLASFPVYRVYVDRFPLTSNDAQMVEAGFQKAETRCPVLEKEFRVLRRLFEATADSTLCKNRLAFVQRLMQFTGPLAAKGVEDTVFYLYNPLISHNEVGDQPCYLGMPVDQFHKKMIDRAAKNNLSFNCTATHDTKRGEDARVRINIISELADEWMGLVDQWRTMNDCFRTRVGETDAPVINDEYFLYQSIVGAFPENLEVTDHFKERTKQFFTKAVREAKCYTNHIECNPNYERACMKFVDGILQRESDFLQSFLPFIKKVVEYANVYSLVQLVIKMMAPGIPDIYQGCELWDLSFVDPDNRKAVDFAVRRKMMREICERGATTSDLNDWLKEHVNEGYQKLFVTQRLLLLRQQFPKLFAEGEYIPLRTAADDKIAFLRQHGNDCVLVLLPLANIRGHNLSIDLQIPDAMPKRWRNIFTSEWVEERFDNSLTKFPVGVFMAEAT